MISMLSWSAVRSASSRPFNSSCAASCASSAPRRLASRSAMAASIASSFPAGQSSRNVTTVSLVSVYTAADADVLIAATRAGASAELSSWSAVFQSVMSCFSWFCRDSRCVLRSAACSARSTLPFADARGHIRRLAEYEAVEEPGADWRNWRTGGAGAWHAGPVPRRFRLCRPFQVGPLVHRPGHQQPIRLAEQRAGRARRRRPPARGLVTGDTPGPTETFIEVQPWSDEPVRGYLP